MTTLRRFYFARRNPSIRRPDFSSTWRSHSDLLETMPSLAERFADYTYCLIERSYGAANEDQFDGIGAFRLASRFASMTEAERQQRFKDADPAGSAAMRADEDRVFSQKVGLNSATAEETVLREAPTTGACLYLLGGLESYRGVSEAGPLRRFLAGTLRGHADDLGRVAISRVVGGSSPLTEIAEIWASDNRTGEPFEDVASMLVAELDACTRGPRAYLTSVCNRVAHGNA